MENTTAGSNVSGSLSEIEQYIAYIKATSFVMDPAERIGLIIELLVLLLVGVFGNSLLITVFARRIKKHRSAYFYNYMIFALAIGDLFTMLFYIPSYLVEKLVVIYDNSGCQFIEYVGAFLLWYIHLMISIAIPLERFFAVCAPLTKFGKREVSIILFSIIGFSILMATPFGVFSSVSVPTGEVVGCHFSYATYVGGTVVPALYFVVGAIAVVVALVLYAIIFIYVVRFRSKSQKLANKDNGALSELIAKTRVVGMLFGVTTFYFVCWLPYFFIILEWIPIDNRYKALFFLNNAVNFILYGVFNANIRKDMVDILLCKFTKRQASHTVSTNNSTVRNSSKGSSENTAQGRSAV